MPIARLEQGGQFLAQGLHVLGGQGVQRTECPLPSGLRIQVRSQSPSHSPVRALQGLQQQRLSGTVHRAGCLPQQLELQLCPPLGALAPAGRLRQLEAQACQRVQVPGGGLLATRRQQFHSRLSLEGQKTLQQPPSLRVSGARA
ncbi:hypothetical protein STIAU_2833, partial [Stigmatella aurantiaca DW4/3-1]